MEQPIGEQVKKYRMQKGLTLSELAERAGVAKSYISSLERNIQSNPSIQLLEKIAQVLNVSIDTLLYGTDRTKAQGDRELPDEWIELVQLAIDSQVTTDQFKQFLEKAGKNNDRKH